jgi:tetratricopeptide (TPR) repeat protein
MRKTSPQKKTNKKKLGVSSAKTVTAGHRFRATNRARTSIKKDLRSEVRLHRTPGAVLLKSSGKASQSKISKTRQVSRFSSTAKRVALRVRAALPKVLPPNPLRLASIRQYESAVRLLYAQNFERAKSAFEKLIQTFGEDKEILERAKSHLRLCEQKIARKPPAPRSVEDLYNVAVALMNEGKYPESIEHLNKALKNRPDCDYVLYALAATYCLTGNVDNALRNLRAAITLKPENRFLAQHDYDFEPLMQDSRFISIVFPERGTASLR